MSRVDTDRYKPLDLLQHWQDNYNHNDVEAIARSIRRFGMNQALRVWRNNIVMAGNHTLQALRLIQEQGPRSELDRRFPPENVLDVGGRWHVQFVDVGHLDPLEAKAYAIADNHLARQAVTDDRLLAQYLQEIAADSDPMLRATGYDREGLDLLLTTLGAETLHATPVDPDPNADARERLRQIDLIYTAGTINGGGLGAQMTRWALVHCCVAVKSGWLYGVRSTDGVCGTAERQEAHRPQFIDNHYHEYSHQQHVAAVQRWRPKYATVRDIMSPAQCEAAGIAYYPLEQILDWAEELSAYAENVIVIPKIDCIDRLPERYLLGYSVPTSYGGTPLPVDRFRGRRVHLLGGSPKRQIQYFQALRDEVVSLDNNYILKLAGFGQVWTLSGTKSLTDLGFDQLTNPLYAALALSFGFFAAYFNKPSLTDAQALLHTFEDESPLDGEVAS